MKRSIILVPALVFMAACGQPATNEAGASDTANSAAPSTATDATQTSTTIEPFVPKGDLSDAQKTNAIAMHDLVFDRAVVERIADKCPTIGIDDAKMTAERNALQQDAKKLFASADEAMTAAGKDEQASMGDNLRKYFQARNVTWESSADEYCAAGKTLMAESDGPGQYLTAK